MRKKLLQNIKTSTFNFHFCPFALNALNQVAFNVILTELTGTKPRNIYTQYTQALQDQEKEENDPRR